jgi:hypothetical protein
MQGPAHSTLQHTPSVQKPEEQSALALQTAPFMLVPQLFMEHSRFSAHCVLLEHDDVQSLVAGSQLYGKQVVPEARSQAPAPSHTNCPVIPVPSQVPALQGVLRS